MISPVAVPMVSGAMRRNFLGCFFSLLLLVFHPEIVVGCCVLFLFRSGGVCQSSVFIQIFSIRKFSLTHVLVSYLLFLPWQLQSDFVLSMKFLRMFLSAAGKCVGHVAYGIPPLLFLKSWI
jgi:hypothetical protein